MPWLQQSPFPLKQPAVTVTVTVVVRLRPPPEPVMVRTYEPLRVPALTVTVIVELPADDGLGLNDAVMPEGSPLTFSVTAPLKPPLLVMFTVVEPRVPCVMERLPGAAERRKSPAGAVVTTSMAVVVRVIEPLLPVIVSV